MRKIASYYKVNPIIESNYFLSLAFLGYMNVVLGRKWVIIYDREDSMLQHQKGFAKARRTIIEGILKKRGFVVIAYFCEIKNGGVHCLRDRTMFLNALKLAKKLSIPIVSPSVERIVRPIEGNRLNPFPPLLDDDMDYLEPLAKNVSIITVIPPDTPLDDVYEVFSSWDRGRETELISIE